MEYREQVAHHEAAHVVISHIFGGGPTGHGIDLDAPTSVAGAFGNAGVATLIHDPDLPEDEQRKNLGRNVAIILAGAVADTRTKGCAVDEALQAQPSDVRIAQDTIALSPLISTADRDPAEVQEERKIVFQVGLQLAEQRLARPDIWAQVVTIATACLANGGKLSKQQIEKLL
ncbi:hypothetical protein WYO_5481 [Methylobacterium sp. GXF4]|uniref:hypothetical protein n=1 Tax=Methylobacterium sp. GXF4 TaxID=1096546 RepID=UPI000269AA11|nr:hypothetical protein [Methylobacterium sp. GXF4]EIZ81893.1 hypothetical protein WYO_5481 [Methylobacterium sp. GXF4]